MKGFLVIILAVFFSSLTFGQANDFIDKVLEGSGINGGEAAYMVLVASDNIGDDANATRAFELLEQLKWVPEGLTIDKKINHAQYAYMLMKAFGVKGGIFYSMFPSPRYAYRELRHLVVIQGATDPEMPVTGSEAMRIIGRIFDVKGVKQ